MHLYSHSMAEIVPPEKPSNCQESPCKLRDTEHICIQSFITYLLATMVKALEERPQTREIKRLLFETYLFDFKSRAAQEKLPGIQQLGK